MMATEPMKPSLPPAVMWMDDVRERLQAAAEVLDHVSASGLAPWTMGRGLTEASVALREAEAGPEDPDMAELRHRLLETRRRLVAELARATFGSCEPRGLLMLVIDELACIVRESLTVGGGA